MKPSLQLRLNQQLSMTPQLQQAIRLLQLSTQDLQTEIQDTIESNPLLEMVETEANTSPDQPYASTSHWASKATRRTADPEDWNDLEEQNSEEFNLQDHLLWQVELSPFTENDKAIAIAIIDAINEDGYLELSLEEIHAGLSKELNVDLEELLSVLRRIQQFDPVGVGARNLKECLSIQLAQRPSDLPFLPQAKQLVDHHLERLAKQEEGILCKLLKVTPLELKQIISLVQHCYPRPGATKTLKQPEYIVPDAFVYKVNDSWRVELNEEHLPKLRVNVDYASLIRRADPSADNQFLRTQLQEARWFLKSLENRQETLLKVVRTIVAHQSAFLERGEEAMRPLVLQTIAAEINMHESTVSRVTTRKYLHTPRGTYELKYFFSSHVTTNSGGLCSATAIRALLKKLIASENTRTPWSDSQLCQLLEAQGIQVARRTVAKYRESLHIPPSNERRRIL